MKTVMCFLTTLWIFFVTILTNASFRYLTITGSRFVTVKMDGADFTSASTTVAGRTSDLVFKTDFAFASIIDGRLTKAEFQFAAFGKVALKRGHLQQFHCTGCSFLASDLAQSDMSYSMHLPLYQLINSRFVHRPDFSDSNLTNAILHNAYFEEATFAQAIMTRVNATQIRLYLCVFGEANLVNCSLIGSAINESTFLEANLTGCYMTGAKVTDTDFSDAIMVNVDFTFAECHNCVFNRTDLTNINFINTSLDGSVFHNAVVSREQLNQARSLKGVIFL